MNRQAVKSSSINSVGYDPAAAVLEIEFNDRAVYQYLAVPQALVDKFLAAPSLGKFFNESIRDVFRSIRL